MLLKFSNWLTVDILKLSLDTKLGGAVDFFIYDSVKILILLFILIFIIGILRTFLPQNKIRQWMSSKGIFGNVFASLFGALTPFCSCSSIPIFLGFIEAGVPLGVTLSFLITSPIINEYLVVLMIGFFGWKITAIYVLSGVIIGTVAGAVLGKMKLERYLVEDMIDKREKGNDEQSFETFKSRVKFGWDESISITRKIWMWVLVGVGIGSLIHNYIPQELIENIISKTGIWGVPLAVILGVPMYGSCAAIVPIAVVLFQKGIPLGTALSFMMAMAALSLPEAIMLRRAMRLPLIVVFFLITTAAIIIIGYLFNYFQHLLFVG